MPKLQDRAFYANDISQNISETPEGFLICKNVRIARTGVQHYLGSELGIVDKYHDMVAVYRPEDEVFHPETLASFEGKPVTDDHPAGDVLPGNYANYAKGHAQHIRKDGEYIMADLIITDPVLIDKIKTGQKRDVSAGYTCHWKPYQDGMAQSQIRANHIAVVKTGRAGPAVTITDSVKKRRFLNMEKTKLAIIAKLADDPELMGEALKMFDSAPAPAQAKEDDKESGLVAKLLAALAPAKTKDADPVAARLDKLEKLVLKLADKKAKDEHEDLESDLEMLEAFEAGEKSAEDEDPEAEEEKAAKDAENVSKLELEAAAGGAMDEDADEDEMKEKAHDAAIVKAFTAMKPVLAKLPRKQQDAIKKALASEMHHIGRTGKAHDQYKTVQKAVTANAKDAAAKSQMTDYSKVGDEIAKKRNPHYQDK